MRLMLILVPVLISLGCPTMNAHKCKGYTTLAKMLALQLAAEIDPASPESKELRDRWADVGELAAQAGCDQWATVEVPEAPQT